MGDVMTDVDRLLEAEQSILDMASELSRMRDAANLLSASQAQVEQVLKSAQSVITTTKNFADQCGAIISKLSSTDLSQIVDALNKLQTDLNGLSKLFQKNSESAMNEARQQGSEVIRRSEELLQTARKTSEILVKQRDDVKSQFTSLQKTIEASDARLAEFESRTKSSQTAFAVILVIVMLLNFATLGLIAFRLFLQ